jgi:hypothetical protein
MRRIELVQGLCALVCLSCVYAVMVNGDMIAPLSFPMGLSLLGLIGTTLWSVFANL